MYCDSVLGICIWCGLIIECDDLVVFGFWFDWGYGEVLDVF